MITLSFNGQILPDWLWVTKAPLHLAAPITWNYMQRKIGSAPTKQYIGPRELPFEVSIMADSPTDLQQKAEVLAALLYTTEPAILQRSDEPGRQYMAIWERNEAFTKVLETGEGVLLFMVPGGLKESEKKETSSFTTESSITISGTFKTFPKFTATFTGASTNYKIANAAGEYVRVIRDFAAGEVLEIDHEKELITLNGVNIMPALDWAKSKFFSLEPGSNTLTITATNQTTKAEYKNKWL